MTLMLSSTLTSNPDEIHVIDIMYNIRDYIKLNEAT